MKLCAWAAAAALFGGVVPGFAPSRAEAQPCCAGASALTPGRLTINEDGLLGLQTRATDIFGSFDGERHFLRASAGANEVDVEEDFVLSMRLTKHAQASLLVPIDETFRRVPGISEWGGGFGDTAVAFRYDFTEAGASETIPGVALVGSVTAPTGVPTEQTTTPLATGATGTGATQLAGGASLEKEFGPVLIDVTGTATWRATRKVDSVRDQDGALFAGSVAGAYSFKSGLVLALSLAYTGELAGSVGGIEVQGGGKSFTRAALSGGYSFNDHWRGQAVFYSDLPIRFLGESEPTGVGGSFILMRSWP